MSSQSYEIIIKQKIVFKLAFNNVVSIRLKVLHACKSQSIISINYLTT
jgi:hypothetical protein